MKNWKATPFWRVPTHELEKLLRTPELDVGAWEEVHSEWKVRHDGLNWRSDVGRLLSGDG